MCCEPQHCWGSLKRVCRPSKTQRGIIILEDAAGGAPFHCLLWYLFFLVADAQLVLSHMAVCSAVTGLIRGGGCPSWCLCWSSAGGPPGCRRPSHPAASLSFPVPPPLSPICPAAPAVISSISRWGFILAISLKPIIRPPPILLLSRSVNSHTQGLDQRLMRTGSLIDASQRIHCGLPRVPSPCHQVLLLLQLSYCLGLCCLWVSYPPPSED